MIANDVNDSSIDFLFLFQSSPSENNLGTTLLALVQSPQSKAEILPFGYFSRILQSYTWQLFALSRGFGTGLLVSIWLPLALLLGAFSEKFPFAFKWWKTSEAALARTPSERRHAYTLLFAWAIVPWDLETIWFGFDTLVPSSQLSFLQASPGLLFSSTTAKLKALRHGKISGRSYSILTAFISYDLYVGHLFAFFLHSICRRPHTDDSFGGSFVVCFKNR